MDAPYPRDSRPAARSAARRAGPAALSRTDAASGAAPQHLWRRDVDIGGDRGSAGRTGCRGWPVRDIGAKSVCIGLRPTKLAPCAAAPSLKRPSVVKSPMPPSWAPAQCIEMRREAVEALAATDRGRQVTALRRDGEARRQGAGAHPRARHDGAQTGCARGADQPRRVAVRPSDGPQLRSGGSGPDRAGTEVFAARPPGECTGLWGPRRPRRAPRGAAARAQSVDRAAPEDHGPRGGPGCRLHRRRSTPAGPWRPGRHAWCRSRPGGRRR